MAKAVSNKKCRGFTLIEITIALLILSAALITLLGLQAAILKRSDRDEEKQQAMLVARTILSAIEVKNRDIDVQDSTSSVDDLLDKLQLNLKDQENDKNIKKFDLMAHLKVENVGLKDIGDNLLKSVSLAVFPKYIGEADEDSFRIVYLIPQESDDDEAK